MNTIVKPLMGRESSPPTIPVNEILYMYTVFSLELEERGVRGGAPRKKKLLLINYS